MEPELWKLMGLGCKACGCEMEPTVLLVLGSEIIHSQSIIVLKNTTANCQINLNYFICRKRWEKTYVDGKYPITRQIGALA